MVPTPLRSKRLSLQPPDAPPIGCCRKRPVPFVIDEVDDGNVRQISRQVVPRAAGIARNEDSGIICNIEGRWFRARDGDRVMWDIGQPMAIDIRPGMPAISRVENVAGAEVGNGGKDLLGVCWVRSYPGDRKAR